MSDPSERFQLSDGDVAAWLDQGTLMLKATTAHGDPVELAEHEVQALLSYLTNALKLMQHEG